MLLALASLLAIPAMVAAGGASAWAAAAVGQSLGAVCFVLVSFGWGVNGPAEVAGLTAPERRVYFANSVKARVVLAMVFLPTLAVVAGGLAPSYAGYAALGLLSTGLTGWTSGWYFIGTRSAWTLFFVDTIPRIIGTFIGIGMTVGFGLSAWWCLAGTTLGVFAAAVLQTGLVLGRDLSIVRMTSIRDALRAQLGSAWVGLVGAAYLALPIALVARVDASALTTFAMMDKLMKQGTTAMGPIHSALQGWVPHGVDAASIRRRSTVAIRVSALLVVAATVGASLVGEPVASLLSARTIQLSPIEAGLIGLAGGLYFLEGVMARAAYVPILGTRGLAWRTSVGVCIGLLAIVFLTMVGGAAGAMAGFGLGLVVRLTLVGLRVGAVTRHT
ncbi:hypothetical protein [Nocardioides pinisoli]|uniref:Polysaccharide biosynthesis protein n=1 Tax=Nocardioides pinisoli TaxID=2950279 RepID=A0ABT1KT44_9ACTN|nr:hypothetical protein [Nocardioides pinisoli]MCP3420919.1 hypothetical protein [Nocardioides pinisoli]